METTARVICPDGTVIEGVACYVRTYQDDGLPTWELYLHGLDETTRAMLILNGNETLRFEFEDGRKGRGILTDSSSGRVQGTGLPE